MSTFWAILGSTALLSIMGALVMLGQFSLRLGLVMGMREYYRWYYVSAGGVALSIVSRLLVISAHAAPDAPAFLSTPLFRLLGCHLPLAASVTVGLIVTLYYWKWLLAVAPGDGADAHRQYN